MYEVEIYESGQWVRVATLSETDPVQACRDAMAGRPYAIAVRARCGDIEYAGWSR